MNYTGTKKLKWELLEAAWRRFKLGDGRSGRAKLFAHFLEQHAVWLGDYTLYRALLEMHHGEEDLSKWPADHCSSVEARSWLQTLPAKERANLEERRRFFAFVQWVAFSQWNTVADLAETLGVALIGDVPVGVAAGGADIFAHQEEFDSQRSCGAPPEKGFQVRYIYRAMGAELGFPTLPMG